MSKASTSAIDARTATYRSPVFHRAVVSNALVDAGRMSATAAATHAVARDAAYLIAGMAGRQRHPASVIWVTARIMAMELQSEVGQRPCARKHGRQPGPAATFGDELANIFIHSRSAADDGRDRTFPFMTVTWTENGAVLGTTEYGGPNAPKRLYCNVALPAPPGAGDWDFVHVPTVGGSLISPPSMAAWPGSWVPSRIAPAIPRTSRKMNLRRHNAPTISADAPDARPRGRRACR